MPPRIDRHELVRNLYKMGVRSVPIVVAHRLLRRRHHGHPDRASREALRRHRLLGWGAGFAILREVGPILIALMFSGRVGANNTAELGTMTVTEQLDGLRALAIDPLRFLIVPRVIAMIVMLFVLTHLRRPGRPRRRHPRRQGAARRRSGDVFLHSFADNLSPGTSCTGSDQSRRLRRR